MPAQKRARTGEDVTFAENVATVRKARGLSYAAFAELLQTEGLPIRRTATRDIEGAGRTVSVGEAAIICRVLERDLIEMMTVPLTAVRSVTIDIIPVSTMGAIDAFIEDPSAGIRRERPERENSADGHP